MLHSQSALLYTHVPLDGILCHMARALSAPIKPFSFPFFQEHPKFQANLLFAERVMSCVLTKITLFRKLSPCYGAKRPVEGSAISR